MRKQSDRAELWFGLPNAVADVLRPELDRLAEEAIDAIQCEVPEYARPLQDSCTATLRRAVRYAIHEFVERLADPATSHDSILAVFREIGRTAATERRSLEPLRTALRVGARVVWQQLCEMYEKDDRGGDADLPARLGEAMFVYIDEIAAACSEGHAQVSAEVVSEMEYRRRLLELVVAYPPASREAIAELAEAAGWHLPRKVAAVALEDRGENDTAPLPPLPPEVLSDMARPDPYLLIPDPDGPGRAGLIERGLRGWPAAVGPAVPLARAGSSLQWARQALALARRGVITPADGVVRCTDHMSTMLILSDEGLARTISAIRLVPLRGLRPAQQDRLAETLLAWLQNAGNATEVARRLHIHPQTVRYRLRQLDELFGDVLYDPDIRFELEIALLARLLLGAAKEAVPPPGGSTAPARRLRYGLGL